MSSSRRFEAILPCEEEEEEEDDDDDDDDDEGRGWIMTS